MKHIITSFLLLWVIGLEAAPQENQAQSQRILILDFNSQYSQLIARRVRQLGVYCQVSPCTISNEQITDFAPHGIILSGGPHSAPHDHALPISDAVFSCDCPVLGICYGMQIMAQQLGGSVATASAEFGNTPLHISDSLLFSSIDDTTFSVWMSHNDHVHTIPTGFSAIAQTKQCQYAAIADTTRQLYGVQFHPEVTNTQHGIQILSNFIFHICNVEPRWQTDDIISESIAAIQKQVGADHVLLAVSGGVDSSVVAALLHRAIGDQLHCIFVDTGLLRLDEHAAIDALKYKLGIDVHCVDAKEQFLTALHGVTDPEQKRKIIGKTFITIFEREAHKLSRVAWLAQGTIYPDVIESAVNGATIKSHHNVGGLPEQMNLKLLEPIKTLFKDEVRAIGIQLGLSKDIVYRHPFPGPGLGIRILGEISQDAITALQKADAIFMEELRHHDLYDTVAQAFAVFLPVQSVGIKGDRRHYGPIIALRAVETTDFMTSDWAELSHTFLTTVANRIVNEVGSISRVTYDISSKPPATIEWE